CSSSCVNDGMYCTEYGYYPQDSINEDSVIPMDSNKGIADMDLGMLIL
ncbi:hypothetical protein OBE_13267, partial [human gut metagenome]